MTPRRSARLRQQSEIRNKERSMTRGGTRYRQSAARGPLVSPEKASHPRKNTHRRSALPQTLDPEAEAVAEPGTAPQLAPPQHSTRYHLLELPAELRNYIYELVLTRERPYPSDRNPNLYADLLRGAADVLLPRKFPIYLLELPAELWNSVYELALTKVSKHRTEPGSHGLEKCFFITPGLLLTCQQIYHEALSLHYRCATLEFGCTEHLGRWLSIVKLAHVKLVTNIHLGQYETRSGDAPNTAEKQREEIEDMQKWLQLDLDMLAGDVIKVISSAKKGEPQWEPLWILRDKEGLMHRPGF